MSDQNLYPDASGGAADHGAAVDLARIADDDRLLDLLAVGGDPDLGDPVTVLLAGWRADIVSDQPAGAATPSVRRAVPSDRSTMAAGSATRRRRSRAGVLVAAGVVALVAAGGTVAAAADARPGSPLWPITRVLYADRASSAVAEQDANQALDEAKAAINNKKYDDAAALLDQAAAKVDEVRDPNIAQRLRDEIEAVRAQLTGLVGGTSSSQPSAGPGSTVTSGASSRPSGSGAPQPSSQPSGLLPTCLLPTGILPLPLPSSPLPGVTC